MANQTVKLSRVLSVSFSSEVITQQTYVLKDGGCKTCGGGCGDGCGDGASESNGCGGGCDTESNGCGGGCGTASEGPLRALTVHEVTDGILHCESPQDTRTLQARYVVTDNDGTGEFMALRAFKNDDELRVWIANIGQELGEVKATLESRLSPGLCN